MKLTYKKIPFRFIDTIPFFLVAIMFSFVVYIMGIIIITKNPVVISEDYKGKILVKHYAPYNTDSTYKAYPKPIAHTLKIDNIDSGRVMTVKFENGETWIVKISNTKNYKIGQRIKAIHSFYPENKTEIVGEKWVKWRKRIDTK